MNTNKAEVRATVRNDVLEEVMAAISASGLDQSSMFFHLVRALKSSAGAGEQEPVAHMWQHPETGNTGFVEHASPEDLAHWERMNSPRKIVSPLYAAPASTKELLQGERELTNAQIDAAEAHAKAYTGDPRDCIKVDVMNAFYAGCKWQARASSAAQIQEPEASLRVVVCAAIRYGDLVICGPRHFDSTMHKQIEGLSDSVGPRLNSAWEQGFVDQFGVFMDRAEALAVAKAARQLTPRHKKTSPTYLLFSEDLY